MLRTSLARLAEHINRTSLWHGEHRVWGQRMASASFDRWLYLRLHRAGWIGSLERNALQQVVRPGMTVLDVGANLGLYTVLLSRLAGPTGRVIAFEPDKHHFALLTRNCALNGCANVEAHNVALGDRSGRLALRKRFFNTGANTLGRPDTRSFPSEVEVDVVSLDEFLPALRPDLVKIDVQGWEVEVLSGMQRMLADSPHIAFHLEYFPEGLRHAGHSPAELLDLLTKQNFQLYLIENSRHTLLDQDGLATLTKRLTGFKYADLYGVR
ncbi:MAG: FkbM family methyltransferase [Opitutaceae bacterium]|jgi:FkbM family methyltransferase